MAATAAAAAAAAAAPGALAPPVLPEGVSGDMERLAEEVPLPGRTPERPPEDAEAPEEDSGPRESESDDNRDE